LYNTPYVAPAAPAGGGGGGATTNNDAATTPAGPTAEQIAAQQAAAAQAAQVAKMTAYLQDQANSITAGNLKSADVFGNTYNNQGNALIEQLQQGQSGIDQ